MARATSRTIAIALGLAACGSSGEDDGYGGLSGAATAATTSEGPGSTGGSEGVGSAGGSGSATGDGTTTGGATSGQPKYDVGAGSGGTTGGDGMGENCRGVDFLFVIDNSGSMADEQSALIASFPQFIAAIDGKLQALGASEFHVLVVDTDAAPVLPGINDPLCEEVCMSYPEGDCSVPCLEALDCTGCGCEVGAGRVESPSGMDCGLAGGTRYITSVQADVPATFQCLADVGTQGSPGERQFDALSLAVAPEAVAAGGCNAGFLRDDAILVVTLITDEDDVKDFDGGGSKGYPSKWFDTIVAHKGGDPEAIVMLGLIGDTGQPGAICQDLANAPDGAEDAQRLRQFVTSFPRHVLGSVCAADYGAFFQDALDLIQTTCDDFVPPG
jgi:hypothetical protein